jgi:GxxExxY protein
MTENEIASIVVRTAIELHKRLGPGLLESVYETCLTHMLIKAGLKVERQQPIPLVFDNIHLQCGFRCDMLVNRKVIIEAKSVEGLNNIHVAQILTHLKLSGMKLGLLMNFNVPKMVDGIRRVVNKL